jgi:hypothetical protein
MRAYRVELLIIDFDGLGEKGIAEVIENTKYPNRCISPSVMSMASADIGEWHDDHPLNKHSSAAAEYARLFQAAGQQKEGAKG